MYEEPYVTLDQVEVKEGVDQETVDAVREVSTYKYGGKLRLKWNTRPRAEPISCV